MRTIMKQLRTQQGYTQKTFAQELGVSTSHYSQVETGDKQPSLNLSLRIKRALNYYGDDIFDNAPVGRK